MNLLMNPNTPKSNFNKMSQIKEANTNDLNPKTKDFKKTIESYRRSHSDLSKDIAEKSVNIIHPINIG